MADLDAVAFAAANPARLVAFWGALLCRTAQGDTLLPDDDVAFPVRFVAGGVPRDGRNRAHFDIASASLDQQRDTVDRALALGATHLDVGQGPDADHVVLADPEGNEFCVIEPGNAFLDGCGLIGALACDGSRAVGAFWRDALGWPFVWDEGEETAIQSPRGGPKISWGGPPLPPQDGANRVRLELANDDADRLVTLGATLLGRDGDARLLADPDGNAFLLR